MIFKFGLLYLTKFSNLVLQLLKQIDQFRQIFIAITKSKVLSSLTNFDYLLFFISFVRFLKNLILSFVCFSTILNLFIQISANFQKQIQDQFMLFILLDFVNKFYVLLTIFFAQLLDITILFTPIFKLVTICYYSAHQLILRRNLIEVYLTSNLFLVFHRHSLYHLIQ